MQTPRYVIEERLLRRNLSLIKDIALKADVEFILAFKAYALWKTFPIFREYISATTASSLYEAQLAATEFGSLAHTYSPAYTDYEIDDIVRCSSHLTFNSLSQYQRYHERAAKVNPGVSIGLRINPEYSEVGTDLYNPCAPGSRFGVLACDLPQELPTDIKGFHCHCHCESGADVFERTLGHIEQKFGRWFKQISWINFGGGHLVTRSNYDTQRLINLLRNFRSRYPHLHVILEPGSAFGWQTGTLVSNVVDIVENSGIRTAILNVSFTCHMPDCLEMPYTPVVRGAEIIEQGEIEAIGATDNSQTPNANNSQTPSAENNQTPSADGKQATNANNIYRLGGNSCLSGDFMGNWRFPHKLEVGDEVVFEDMLHYTTVKTNMFNGITHPSIMLLRTDGTLQTLRQYDYNDYKQRMD